MGWYLRALPRCSTPGCGKPATEELYNAVNAPCGTYCSRHAVTAWKDAIRRYEAKDVG